MSRGFIERFSHGSQFYRTLYKLSHITFAILSKIIQNNSNMELHIKERIFIPQLLPQQTASFIDFNTKREILKKVALTDADKEKYEIVQEKEEQKIVWNAQKDVDEPLVVDFTESEIALMKKACEELPATAYPDDFWLVVEKIYDAAAK